MAQSARQELELLRQKKIDSESAESPRSELERLRIVQTQSVPAEPPKPTIGERFKGAGLSLLKGFPQVGKSVTDLAAIITPKPFKDEVGAVQDFFQRGIDSVDAFRPESVKRSQQRGFINQETGNLQVPSPEAIVDPLLSSIPQIPFFLGGAAVIKPALLAAKVSPKIAAALGFGITNTALVAPGQYFEILKEAKAAGVSDQMAIAQAKTALKLNIPLTMVTGTVGAKIAGLTGAQSKSLIGALVKGFLAEAPFEGIEEASQSAISDVSRGRDINLAAVADRGLIGAAAGGLPGSAIAALNQGVGETPAPAPEPSIVGPVIEALKRDTGGLVEPLATEAAPVAPPAQATLPLDEVPVEEGVEVVEKQVEPEPEPTLPKPTTKLFTEEAANAARERLKSKLGTPQAGLDPESLKDAAVVAGFHVEQGARTFTAFSKAMIKDFGDAIKPFLRDLYESVRKQFKFEGMDAEVKVETEPPVEPIIHSDKQKVALEKAGIGHGDKTVLETVNERLTTALDEVVAAKGDPDSRRQSIIDRFHGLRAAEKNIGGIPWERSPYTAARMSTGLPTVMEAVNLYGAPIIKDGTVSIKPGSLGLLDALRPAGANIDSMLGWQVGRRAKLLKKQDREKNFTNEDIDALLSLNKGNETSFQEAADNLNELKTSILDFAEFSGGIIDGEARAAWDHSEYIPFYRIDGDDSLVPRGKVSAPRLKKGLSGQTAGIRRLKGGKNILNDPLSNITRNFTKLIDASLQNRAALLAVDELGGLYFKKIAPTVKPVLIPMAQVKKHLLDNGMSKQSFDVLPEKALNGVQKMLSITAPTDENVVRVMRDGKPEFYEVLESNALRAMTSFGDVPRGTIKRMAMWFKHLLTATVTATLEFSGANAIRDTGSTFLFTDKPLTHIPRVAKSIFKTLRRDKTTQELMMAGSSFIGGHYFNGDPDVVARHIRRQLRRKGLKGKGLKGFLDTIAGTPAAIWNAWLNFSSAIENANRRALFDAGQAVGKPLLQSMFEAKDLLDFSMHGDAELMRHLVDTVPFFGARTQGIYKTGRVAAENPKTLAIRGAQMATFTIALTLWNLKHYKEEFEDLQEWDKNAYWHIAPGTLQHTRIPKPFEFGVFFATVPERLVTSAAGIDENKESLDALMSVTMENLGLNPIPQILRPITEQLANKNWFTGRPIESVRDKNRLPINRAEFYTSDTMKKLSGLLGGKVSPKRLEALWRGYTAGMGDYILATVDWMIRQARGDNNRPAWSIRDYPGIGRFVRGGNPAISTASVTEFYDLFDLAEQYEDAVKTNIMDGKPKEDTEKILKEWGWLIGGIEKSKRARAGVRLTGTSKFRQVQKKMTDARKAIEAVFKDKKLSPLEKRKRIDAITKSRNDGVRDFVKQVKDRQLTGGE